MTPMPEDEIDCGAVVAELYTFLDGELTESRRVQISAHMHGCVDCHEVIEFHAELKMAIAQKCREQVPDEMRARIAKALGMNPPSREFPGFSDG
ncbi:MAG TPA: mycothiol system anti-sigma-R factor [Acidimicrobiales bacterium]